MNKISVGTWDELQDRKPAYALVADVDLVVVRFDEEVNVLYGRRAHRGALMSDGHVRGDNLICGVHGWDYRLDTGISEYNNSETLARFNAWIELGHHGPAAYRWDSNCPHNTSKRTSIRPWRSGSTTSSSTGEVAVPERRRQYEICDAQAVTNAATRRPGLNCQIAQ